MRKIIDGKEMYSPDEVCKIIGIKYSTLRVYKEKQLVSPRPTQQGKVEYKWYSEEDLFKLNLIRIYVRLHYPLEEIKNMFNESDCDYISILDSQIIALRKEAAEINRLIEFAEAAKRFGVGSLAGNLPQGLSVDKFLEKHPAEIDDEIQEDDDFEELFIRLKKTRSRKYNNVKVQDVINEYTCNIEDPDQYISELIFLMSLVGESIYTKKCRRELGDNGVQFVVKAFVFRFLIDMEYKLAAIRREYYDLDSIVKQRAYIIKLTKQIERMVDDSKVFKKVELQDIIDSAIERLQLPDKIALFMRIIELPENRLLDDEIVTFVYEKLVSTFDPRLLGKQVGTDGIIGK